MTSVVVGGLFKAFVFAGAGYLFQKFNKDGYDEETKRHDLAMEQLEKARQEWNQKDVERLEKAANLRQERSDADTDFGKINKSLKDYDLSEIAVKTLKDKSMLAANPFKS